MLWRSWPVLVGEAARSGYGSFSFIASLQKRPEAYPPSFSAPQQLLRFLLSTLSSHLLSTPSPLVLTSLLSALVSLAPSCPDTLTYLSLLRTITSCASAPSSLPLEAGGDEADDAEKRYQACLTALSRLAEIAARKNGGQGKLGEEGEGFLTEVLALFNRQAAALRGKKVRPSQRSETLLALVPVLSTFLTLSSFSPSSHISSSLSALFRSFWYTCLLNGFLSSNGGTYATGGGWAKLSEWQQEALRSVAERSPSLVSGVGDELVEMFAALEGILKAGEHPMVRSLLLLLRSSLVRASADDAILLLVQSIDALRTDLSTSVPSQSSAARSLSSSHAVFLTTILRLESLRASGGSISPFFSYLSVPVLTNSPTTTSTSREPALADALKSVGDKVLSTYSHHLSQQVTSHSLDPRAYSEVREVLLACVNQRSQGGRETALRWLDNVLSSFPSLVCDLEVVTVMLELMTTVRKACLAEFTDEVRFFLSSPLPVFQTDLSSPVHAHLHLPLDPRRLHPLPHRRLPHPQPHPPLSPLLDPRLAHRRNHEESARNARAVAGVHRRRRRWVQGRDAGDWRGGDGEERCAGVGHDESWEREVW